MAGLSNKDIAVAFREMETLFNVLGEPDRGRNYGRLSRIIEGLPDSAADLAVAGTLADVKGIGPPTQVIVAELVDTGTIALRDELAERASPGVLEMLRIPGLGPKKINAIVHELGIRSIEELQAAATDGRLATITGFGKKTALNILEGIAYLNRTRGFVRMSEAHALSAVLVESLGLKDAAFAGSLRRGVPVIDEIAIVAVGKPESIEVPGATLHDGVWSAPRGAGPALRIRLVERAAHARALFEETGPADHVAQVLKRTGKEGSEDEIYASRGLHFVPPEIRHAYDGTLEISDLVQTLQGLIHAHTTWSDGKLSIAEMADAARERGYGYLGITDHSRFAVYARGLSIEQLREQRKEIDAVNESATDGFRVLQGTEVDILPEGGLDYPDDVLQELDFVIASIHSAFSQDPDFITERVVGALRNPHVDILGHSTGRLLLRRDGYSVDLDRVLREAGDTGTMIELNANPWRLDLDPERHAEARELGIKIPICPDAHDAGGMDHNTWGLRAARHGGLRPEDVPNSGDVDAFLESCKS